MNAANHAFHFLTNDLQKSVDRFMSPLAGDFFLWCRENTGFRDAQFSLKVCLVDALPTDPYSLLKRRFEKAMDRENKRNRAHYTFTKDRLETLAGLATAIERFERTL